MDSDLYGDGSSIPWSCIINLKGQSMASFPLLFDLGR